jgi:hypothetical protein
MAKKSRSYDDPAYRARYSSALNLPAVAASVSAGKFLAFAAMKIKSITGIVNIAGTATAAAYNIYNGTSSIGAFAVGTNAAGSALTDILPDATLAEGGYLDFKTAADSATVAISVAVEYELTPGADLTA